VIDGLYQRIAEPGYLGDLPSRPMPELRTLRAECQRVEDAVSYQRRLVQGRLDILQAEHDRRRAGLPPADLEALVASLPGALAAGVAGPRRGHTTYEHELVDADEVSGEVDAVVGPEQLAALPTLAAGDLVVLTDRLRELEKDVSARRRVLFDRLDALADELGRRYRDGETSVDSLLS
jgi:hypothetical protein